MAVSSKSAFYIKLVIAIFLFGVGLYFIIYPEKFVYIPKEYTFIIGLLLMARGIFRGYTAYKNDFKNNVQ